MRNGRTTGIKFLCGIVIVILGRDFRRDTGTEGAGKISNEASIMSKLYKYYKLNGG